MNTRALLALLILAGSNSSCAGRTSDIEAQQRSSDDRDGADDNLGIEFACGFRSATLASHSDYLSSGQICGEGSDGINTFALKLSGTAAGRYSAVARCGYIRYDNGTFVGERVEVEARDGQWCDDLAVQRLKLADRMLLTDVSFAIEARDGTTGDPELALAISTRGGWTNQVPAETNLCVYVANRQLGAWACSLAPPADYCVCPSGDAWQDFITGIKLSLVQP